MADAGAWARIEGELARRGKGTKWLADQLGMSLQRIVNWKSRGVPPSALPALAEALDVTVDWLSGRRRRRPADMHLTEVERALVLAFREQLAARTRKSDDLIERGGTEYLRQTTAKPPRPRKG